MTVIYLFVSPSGRAYAGRHTCQHEGWPRRGSGALPSGYRGSGKLWANVTRRHGPAIRWIILRRFGPDAARTAIDAAERRAIRLARHLWAGRCVNLLEGGQGFNSAEAKTVSSAMWADPVMAAKNRANLAALWADPSFVEAKGVKAREPEVRARNSAAQKARAATPEGAAQLTRATAANQEASARARQRAARKAYANSPEGRAQLRQQAARHADTAEGRLQLDRAREEAHSPEGRAKMRAAAKARRSSAEGEGLRSRLASAEVRAKAEATKLRNQVRAMNARNKARREAEQEAQQ